MTSPDLGLLGTVRSDWTLEEARAIYTAPFSDLLFHAQRVQRFKQVSRQSQRSDRQWGESGTGSRRRHDGRLIVV